ncbi:MULTISPECIES: hypothetical protein [unclassified Pseudomonas]|uniref:hypothetical protein n=1 Tax=unclassified Pseudomonas TaxID=196821 RepID=UPI0011AF617C|nr:MULTISPECIES: hypothetical protein [unclassified Pseudomonas]
MPINVSVTWKVLWSIIGFLTTVVGATIYLTWEIRKDYIEDLKNQIAVYNQAESWKLPDTLKKLNTVSETLQSQLASAEEIKNLKTALAISEAESKKSALKLVEATTKAEELSAEVDSLSYELRKSLGDTSQFKLREGQTAELVKNRLVFGVSSISSGIVWGYVNNDSVTIKIAGSQTVRVNNELCSITLIQTEYPTATISFSCPKPAEKS